MVAPGEAVSESVYPASGANAVRGKAAKKPVQSAEVSNVAKSAFSSARATSSAPAKPAAVRNINSDKVSISENGSIDLNMFNYIDKGGDAGEALGFGSGSEGEKAAFAPKPNFVGISVTRYNQMKSEIEANYSSDPVSKAKYMQELDKALDDYILMQAKLAEQLSNGKNSGEEADKSEEGGDVAELKMLYQVGSRGVKAIIDKVLGESEGNYSEEINKAVDDLFIGAYRQNSGADARRDIFGEQAGNTDTRKIWNSIKLHLDSED